MSHWQVSEDDEQEYRQDTLMERHRERLHRIARLRGPDTPEPCESCGGEGRIYEWFSECCGQPPASEFSDLAMTADAPVGVCSRCHDNIGFAKEDTGECSPCLGSGVQQ